MNPLYETITNKIIAELESGKIPWERPWVTMRGCVSHVTGRRYSILNSMLLERAGEYVTFNQVNLEGGRVRKGAHGQRIYFWRHFKKLVEHIDEDGNKHSRLEDVPVLKTYVVFHLDDCEGISPKFSPKTTNAISEIDTAEKVIKDYLDREKIELEFGGNESCYSVTKDNIHLPNKDSFKSTESFYSVAFHELSHSTGSKNRLARRGIVDLSATFGTALYAQEELVAELGASMAMAELGLNFSVRNSAAYIQSWIKALKNDPKMVVMAASQAEKAVKFIFNETTEERENVCG